MTLQDFGKTATVAMPVPRHRYEEGEYLGDEKNLVRPQQWVTVADGKFMSAADTLKILPAGAYEITLEEQSRKPLFVKKNLVHDKIIPLSGLPEQISKEIEDFWDKSALFTKLGFLHRRGYLLYGAHGTGKSSLIHEIVTSAIKKGGVVLYCDNPGFFQQGLSLFRQIELDRQVVCIFEDIDAIIKNHGENVLLSILDGENQISRVCNIATTNYPEMLDKRIVGRPRRFDRVYKIASLDTKARKTFLKAKLPAKTDLKEWVMKTDGLSIASISEAIISVFCFGKTLDEAVILMRDLATDKSSDEYREVGVGFQKETREDLEDDFDDDD